METSRPEVSPELSGSREGSPPHHASPWGQTQELEGDHGAPCWPSPTCAAPGPELAEPQVQVLVVGKLCGSRSRAGLFPPRDSLHQVLSVSKEAGGGGSQAAAAPRRPVCEWPCARGVHLLCTWGGRVPAGLTRPSRGSRRRVQAPCVGITFGLCLRM